VGSASRRSVQRNFIVFITTRGEVKAASRAVIGGWFKEPFKDLGIVIGPGSIRLAVASFDFENNVSLDTILEKGNRRGLGDFFKHYCKPVQKLAAQINLNLKGSLFKAVYMILL
jgi:hypothetical protein